MIWLFLHVRISVCVILTSTLLLDFDDDGTLDSNDLEKLVNCLTGEADETKLSSSEMKQLISNVSSLRLLVFKFCL